MSYHEAKAQAFDDAQSALARNWHWPVGSAVTVRRDHGSVEATKTRSEPWMIGGVAVILVDGISGAYRLDRVTIVESKAN